MTLYLIRVGQDDGEQADHNYQLPAPSKEHAAVAAFILDGGTSIDCDQPFCDLVKLAMMHCTLIEANPNDREEDK
jgi:hypothetical protein